MQHYEKPRDMSTNLFLRLSVVALMPSGKSFRRTCVDTVFLPIMLIWWSFLLDHTNKNLTKTQLMHLVDLDCGGSVQEYLQKSNAILVTHLKHKALYFSHTSGGC
ncbi:unnamed protein product [Urochloa humidicola]